MGQGLDGLGVVDVVADHHEPLAEVGIAVGAAQVRAPMYVESSFSEEVLQSVPQPCGGLSGQEDGLADLGIGQRRPVGLPDVEHRDWFGRHNLGPVQDAAPVVAHRLAGGVEAGLAAGDGSEDLDAGLPAAHLASHGLERLVAGDVGRLGVLEHDEQAVPEQARPIASDVVFRRLTMRAGASDGLYRAIGAGTWQQRKWRCGMAHAGYLVASDA